MNKKIRKKLVIDASIANSAGKTEHPISKSCRNTLDCVLQCGYLIVMTPDIFTEWKNNTSKFSIVWLSSMVARKKVFRIKIEQNSLLRERLEDMDFSEKNKNAVIKDVHLVEAALETDKIVISGDDMARNLFRSASRSIGEIKQIIWVNPIHDDEKVVVWLESGTPYNDRMCLGYDEA